MMTKVLTLSPEIGTTSIPAIPASAHPAIQFVSAMRFGECPQILRGLLVLGYRRCREPESGELCDSHSAAVITHAMPSSLSRCHETGLPNTVTVVRGEE